MSVRNILDGTIKVGGGTVSGEDIKTNTISAKKIDLRYEPGDTLYDPTQHTRLTPTYIGTTTLTSDEIRSLKILMGARTVLEAIENNENKVTTDYVEATKSITTPSLTLGGNDVLKMTSVSGTQTLNAVFVGGETGTYSANVSSRILDITTDIHALDVIAVLSECKTMTTLTIPTGLMLEGRQTRAYSCTPCKTGDTFVGADTEIYMESGQLMAKLTFKSTPDYSSMLIKISMIFY